MARYCISKYLYLSFRPITWSRVCHAIMVPCYVHFNYVLTWSTLDHLWEMRPQSYWIHNNFYLCITKHCISEYLLSMFLSTSRSYIPRRKPHETIAYWTTVRLGSHCNSWVFILARSHITFSVILPLCQSATNILSVSHSVNL